MRPLTVYVSNTECKNTSGKGIAEAIVDELKGRGVPAEKIMSLGSDGASVMTGKHNGNFVLFSLQYEIKVHDINI